MGARDVQPEWLDRLPAEDPRALHARADLRRLNVVMGHAALLRRALRADWPSARPVVLVELGAGDGSLMLRVARALRTPPQPVRILMVDQCPSLAPRTVEQFARAGWQAESVAADVFDWLGQAPVQADAVLCNLFLHHFEDVALARLLALAARRTRRFIALEPARTRVALGASRLVGALGCNAVTRHDAHVSVRAGFSARELSRLWPAGSGWRVAERRAGLFSHAFEARRETPHDGQLS